MLATYRGGFSRRGTIEDATPEERFEARDAKAAVADTHRKQNGPGSQLGPVIEH
jgi:hypothetical protein